MVSPVPQTTRRNDHDIRADIFEELLRTSSTDTRVGIAVKGGAVTLSGEVGSLPERLATKRAVMRVAGVVAVADELQVNPPGTSATNDIDIAQAAERLLGSAVDVPFGAVKVEVHDHVVTLSGQVTWNSQREAAIQAVKYINGVTAVTNSISLRQESRPR